MPNNYVLLETIALTQSAASVTFDNLPTSGYTDLKIVVSARTTLGSSVVDGLGITFNTGGTYSVRRLYGTGSAAASDTTNSAPFTTASTATASTFGNAEIYIPNYRSSNAKSFSVDGVSENNATAAYAGLMAGLWSGTAAITSIVLASPGSASFVADSTFSLYGVAALGTTPVLAPKATGGNIVANDGTYWYHAFTSSGNFVPQVGLTADVLVIAGGGGAGCDIGGGGGAGGVLAFASQALANGISLPCTIGAGGAGATSSGRGTVGVDSQFSTLTLVKGGGGGGGNLASNGGDGGSGGGAGYSGGTAGNATSGQGSNGGAAVSIYAAGGGGKGAVGVAGTTSGGGAGGAGTNTVTNWGALASALSATTLGVSGLIAGGGGAGGHWNNGNPGGAGGSGGGGTGATATGTFGTTGASGTASTGSGGGGGTSYSGIGGAGGSGIILIRYPIA